MAKRGLQLGLSEGEKKVSYCKVGEYLYRAVTGRETEICDGGGTVRPHFPPRIVCIIYLT